MISLPIIVNNGNFSQFIECWSQYYNYGMEELYLCIKKNELSEQDLWSLYIWKNGMKLSFDKEYQLKHKILPKLNLINNLKLKDTLEFSTVNEYFKDLSAIWRIFLAHIINPTIFPIFDQHVYRAVIFLKYNMLEELGGNDKHKIQMYETVYLPFYEEIKVHIKDYKKFDEAMWVFGKLLKQTL